MAKKKRSRTWTASGFGAKNLTPELRKAEALMARKNWVEAYEVLIELNRTNPNQADVLLALIQVCYELNDLTAYQRACEQLLEINPGNANVTYGLAGAYLTNLHPLLALKTYRHFLDQWPHHERADDVRKILAGTELEQHEDDLLADLNLSGEEGFELAVLHERGQAYLEEGEYAKARQAEEELLRQRPDFVSARNNLSLVSFMEGKPEEAIAITQQVLDTEPDNIHALSNLTRYRCLQGQLEQAQEVVERLKVSQAKAYDAWTKKIEALSYVGDHQGIMELFQQAEAAGDLETPTASAMFHHLVAVAMARLGQTTEARQQWQLALEKSPNFDLALTNLADLDEPISNRHGPWPFSLQYWFSREAIDELITVMRSPSKKREEDQLTEATQRHLEKHPQFTALVPVLLDRGDPPAREFALKLASLTQTPEVLEALRAFALGQRGPDRMRHQAAITVSQAGLLPAGEEVRLWLQGEWREVLLIAYEFHDELLGDHSPQVEHWLMKGTSLLKTGTESDAAAAERLFQKALKVEPNAPDLLNNLAGAYSLQGRHEEAVDLILRLTEQYPDYVFARAAMANLYLLDDDTEAAEELLKPLLSRQRFHFSEFAAFSGAYLQLLTAQNNLDAARSWLGMWEGVDPGNPDIKTWKKRLASPVKSRSKRQWVKR